MWSSRNLFGGAISCELPTSWTDLSDIRQVPDNQEVFCRSKNSGVGPDGACLVIEILEFQECARHDDAASFFFQDLSEANGSGACNRFDGSPKLPTLPMQECQGERIKVVAGIGVQKVVKENIGFANVAKQQIGSWIRVELCVLRLIDVSAEVLITLSTPTSTPQSPATVFSEQFSRVLSSFEIKDWGLFG